MPEHIGSMEQSLLAFQTITFVLGTHFKCPPHMWDNQPVARVLLDYQFVTVANELKNEAMEKIQKDAQRKSNISGGAKNGKPLRTTSDSESLGDFFERTNQDMR
tara:strand:+ start:208 stop:519 length:312 start_codon:yes stop_codon:yes gene_type:complete